MLSPINAEQDTFVQRCLRELGMGYDGDENIVDLSQLTSDYVAQDGDVLTGSLKAEVMISVADGASITLKECNIQQKSYQHPTIICLGSAEIITSGVSILGGTLGYPAIYVPEGGTLTLSGFGTLSTRMPAAILMAMSVAVPASVAELATIKIAATSRSRAEP